MIHCVKDSGNVEFTKEHREPLSCCTSGAEEA